MRKEGQIVRRVLVIIPRCKCVDFSHRGGVADPMPPQEPAKVNRLGLPKRIHIQSIEDEFRILGGLAKFIYRPQENRAQLEPARVTGHGIDVCGCYGDICLEWYLPDVGGGDSSARSCDLTVGGE